MPLFDGVVPETFDDNNNVVALFKCVVPDTLNVPTHETLPLSTIKTSVIISGLENEFILLI